LIEVIVDTMLRLRRLSGFEASKIVLAVTSNIWRKFPQAAQPKKSNVFMSNLFCR